MRTEGDRTNSSHFNPHLAANGDYDAQGFATPAKQDSLATNGKRLKPVGFTHATKSFED